MVSPAGASLPSCPGKAVARSTTSAVTQGRVPPWRPSRLAMADPALQMTKDSAIASPPLSTESRPPPWESPSSFWLAVPAFRVEIQRYNKSTTNWLLWCQRCTLSRLGFCWYL